MSHEIANAQVYYETGPVDGSGDWNDLDDDGVIGVVVHFTDGTRNCIYGFDYYFKADGPRQPIFGANNREDNAERYENAVVLSGRWTDDNLFASIVESMHV
jgi:hypothetical protein